MISSYLSLAICLVICTKLMFFMNAPRMHAPVVYNWCALMVTIYAGSRSIEYLAALNLPTSTTELFFNSGLLAVVLILSARMHRQWARKKLIN
ncbi:hypothetical protein [Pantoea eucrina]|uniref:hypothetical protein n=1 Tax=Pantoea eucrina TaxID=472693 RepID=UPI00080F4BFD|nr:hypothetical protein [Pantoea eucrina]